MTATAPKNLTVASLYRGAGTWAVAKARYEHLQSAAQGLAAQTVEAFNGSNGKLANPVLGAFYPFDRYEAQQLVRAAQETKVLARAHLAAWAKENQVTTRTVLATPMASVRDKAAVVLALISGKPPVGYEAPLPEALRVLPGRAGAPDYHPEATPSSYQAIFIEALDHELAQETALV